MKELMNYTLSNDKVFKRAFDEEKYITTILSDLEIIKGEVNDFKIENCVDEGEDINLKSTIYDIKVSMLNEDVKTFINLEMQNQKPKYNINSRIMYYFSKMIARSQPKSGTYLNNRCIMVLFLNYSLIDDNKYIRALTMNDKIEFGIDEHKIYLIELTKVDFCDKSRVKKWLEIFNAKDLEKFKKEGGIMKEFAEKLEQINKDRIFQAYLDSIEIKEKDLLSEKEAIMAEARAKGMEEGRAEGRAEGHLTGEKSKALEVAKNMKNKGFENSSIVEITGLTMEEVNNI